MILIRFPAASHQPLGTKIHITLDLVFADYL